MPGRQDRLVGVVEQVAQLEVGRQHRHSRMVVDEREVGVAAAQVLGGLGGLGLLHRQLDVGVALVEGGHGTRSERGAAALERDQAQPPAAQPGERGQLLLGRVDARQDRVRVGHEHATGVGQPHAAPAALHQLRPDLALQRGHVLGDGRLREAERRGGGRE
jgi:hypothetical protein